MARIVISVLEAICCIAMMITTVMWILNKIDFSIPIFVWLVFVVLVAIDTGIDAEGY